MIESIEKGLSMGTLLKKDCSLLIKFINLKYILSQLKHTLQKIKYIYFYKEGIKDNADKNNCGYFPKD